MFGPGSVWRDRDPRMWSGNRRVRVVSTETDGSKVTVSYQQCIGANDVSSGQTFKSRYERFRRAFMLISEPTREWL